MLLPSSAETVAPTDALPVRLHLRGPHAGAVERWVLSVGWQPVTDDVGVPSALALVDVPAALQDPPETAAAVLLVADDAPEQAATAAVRLGVAEVVAWPEERTRLPEIAGRVVGRRMPGQVEDLRVSGGAGGVGASLVAQALAGLCAWRGRRTLVLRSAVRVGGAADELEGTAAWRAAVPVPGVQRLRRLEVPDPGVTVAGGPAELVVRDLGVSRDTDVLVIRRDRAGLEAAAATTAAVIVVNGDGPATSAAFRRAAAGRRAVIVPWSARVARADLHDRVPAGLPGTWLRTLASVLGRETSR